MTTKKTSTKKMARNNPTEAEQAEADLAAFPHHMGEVLRITRTWDTFPTYFYNALTEAWNDFVNDTFTEGPNVHLWDSEEYIRLILAGVVEGEGGAE